MFTLKILPTQELREYIESESLTNWTEETDDEGGCSIVITYHSPEDLFRIGTQFGQWHNSVVRLQNYID